MENTAFFNGVNLLRQILEQVCGKIDTGYRGQATIMEQLVEPATEFLDANVSELTVNDEVVDVLSDKLGEHLEIPSEVANAVIDRIRAIRHLRLQCVELPLYITVSSDDAMTVVARSPSEALRIMKQYKGIEQAPYGAEFETAEVLAEIYDTWCEEDLGVLHPILYDILKIGRLFCDDGLKRLEQKGTLIGEDVVLERRGYEALDAVDKRKEQLLDIYPEYRDRVEDGDAYDDYGCVFGDLPNHPIS